MKFRRLHTLFFLLAALLTMAAGVGCVEPYDGKPSEYVLSFKVAPSGADLMTKADVTGTADESKIYDLRVWAFPSQIAGMSDAEANTAVAYWEDKAVGGQTSVSVNLPFPNSVNGRLDNDPSVSVDLYVLANAPSVGSTFEGLSVTRADLEGAKITGISSMGFGTACVDDTFLAGENGKGLPMTGTLSDVDITFLKNAGTGSLSSPISLKRAVSKIRFVFAKASNMTADTEISSIEIIDSGTTGEGMLPGSTYLFPRSPFALPENQSYATVPWTGASGTALLPNEEFVKIDTPLRLRKDSEIISDGQSSAPSSWTDPKVYEEFLTTEIDAGYAIQKILYLRESDKSNIKARISYKIGGVSKTPVDIAIPAVASTDTPVFQRNRWWTVYVYFISYELGFQVTVNDKWDGYGAVNVAG